MEPIFNKERKITQSEVDWQNIYGENIQNIRVEIWHVLAKFWIKDQKPHA